MFCFRLGVVLTLAASAPAMGAILTGSSPGYHHFWMAGATIERHDEAVVD